MDNDNSEMSDILEESDCASGKNEGCIRRQMFKYRCRGYLHDFSFLPVESSFVRQHPVFGTVECLLSTGEQTVEFVRWT